MGSTALLFDRSDRVRLAFSGPQAVQTLDGLVTNDVASLTPGQGQYAAVLTAKGKIVADVRIFARADDILLDTSAAAGPGLRAMFAKYVNPRFATQTDLTERLGDLGLWGDGAASLIGAALGLPNEAVQSLPPFAHLDGQLDASGVMVVRAPDLGPTGYDLIAPQGAVDALREALTGLGATMASSEAWTALRVEIGWPLWGVDMDDTTLAQEANLDALHGISFTKGCYVGQETVARIHFRGHVNRTLRRLVLESGDPLPPRGTPVLDTEGAVLGDIRSATLDAYGRAIGLGMMRRTMETGDMAVARWDDGETKVRIAGLAVGTLENATGAVE